MALLQKEFKDNGFLLFLIYGAIVVFCFGIYNEIPLALIFLVLLLHLVGSPFFGSIAGRLIYWWGKSLVIIGIFVSFAVLVFAVAFLSFFLWQYLGVSPKVSVFLVLALDCWCVASCLAVFGIVPHFSL